MQNGTNISPTPPPAPPQYQDEARYQAPPPQRRRDLPYKIPFLAGFLSGLIPGLGHIYLGLFREGSTLFAILAGWIMLITTNIEGLLPIAIVGLVFSWFFSIIDAVRRTQIYNFAVDNDGSAPAVQGFEIPGRRGSIVGGVILIVVGLLIFMNLRFQISMAWLEDWWPLGLVALGVWLVVKARSEKSTDPADATTYDKSGDTTSNP